MKKKIKHPSRDRILKIIFGFLMILAFRYTSNAQVLVAENAGEPDSTAMLEVRSTTSGLLPPRMTAVQRNAIINPTPGLIIYCIDCMEMQMFNDTAWTNMIGLPPSPGSTMITCGESFDYNGQTYGTVQIGSQCWMAENLNIGTMIDNTSNQTDNGIIEKFCYNNDEANCAIYGGMYQWNEIMKYTTTENTQGICPSGWHLPSDEEYKELEIALGMTQSDADMIQYRGTDQGSRLAGNEALWSDDLLDQDAAFGSSGFNAIPGGFSFATGAFVNNSFGIYIWTSTEQSMNNTSWIRFLLNNNSKSGRGEMDKFNGLYTRCVQD